MAMGAMLAFPSQVRDYTDDFPDWEQQRVCSLSAGMQTMITEVEDDWKEKWHENKMLMGVEIANRVHPRIWIGTADCAEDETFLMENQIDTILNMAEECSYDSLFGHIETIRIGIKDGAISNVGVFEKAAEVINTAVGLDRNILVHCAAGVSRSATAVISYLMLYRCMGFAESLEELREKRPCVNPHPLLVRTLVRDFGDRFIS